MTTGNGGPGAEEGFRVVDARSSEGVSLTQRWLNRLGVAIAYLLAFLVGGTLVLGALALIAAFWRVVRWGFGL